MGELSETPHTAKANRRDRTQKPQLDLAASLPHTEEFQYFLTDTISGLSLSNISNPFYDLRPFGMALGYFSIIPSALLVSIGNAVIAIFDSLPLSAVSSTDYE